MKYAYEDLSDDQFEELIIVICQKIFGISVQGFAKGPDGGRDAKFVGTAESYPSTSAPWVGTTIIQAKHTKGYNKSFSETDFYSKKSKSTILEEEIPRITSLVDKKQLDHYMLFSNRKLTGNMESEIRSYISTSCKLPESSISICGIGQIELWLKVYPDIADIIELDPIDSPLIVSPDELSEVVEALVNQKDSISKVLDDPPKPRVKFSDKNKINSMSANYADAQRKKYLKETGEIKAFLADPDNYELLQMYESVVDEFQLKIISKRKDYQDFDEVMEYLVNLLFNRDAILRKNKRITRTMLFYMYWNCDIGEDESVSEAN